jgi:hypothetical protein
MKLIKIILEEINKLSESKYNLSDFDIKPSSDNIHRVGEANDLTVSVSYETISPNQLHGGIIKFDKNERKRVEELKNKILSDDGYISRIIIDGNNHVVEGQHRFQALLELGFDYIPVVRLKGIDDYIKNPNEIRDILRKNGVHNSDIINQLTYNIAKIISDEKGDIGELVEYIPPKGYENAWNAAIKKIIKDN